MDTVDRKTRSSIMSRVKGKHTKPELLVRKALYAAGFRYRLHYKKLPGHPDIVLPKYKAIVLVNGCFWHGHKCHLGTIPATRRRFWLKKFDENRRRDQKNIRTYTEHGWRVIVIWECALKGKRSGKFDKVVARMVRFLNSSVMCAEIAGRG